MGTDDRSDSALLIPSAAIACLWWCKKEHPEGWRRWWAILSRTWNRR
jgi:hypothetical protein